MYKVQISIVKHGCRKRVYEGIYMPPEEPIPIPEMRRRCLEFFRKELVARYPEFQNANVEISIFKKLTTDFVYDDRRK